MVDAVKPELQSMKTGAIEYMRRYMKYGGSEGEDDPDYDPAFDAGYTEEHLKACEQILDNYLHALTPTDLAGPGPARDAQIMAAVEKVVLELGALNLSCEESLVETEEREQLCAFIHAAASQAGLDSQDDITYEWREW
jgi:hypothetical protein